MPFVTDVVRIRCYCINHTFFGVYLFSVFIRCWNISGSVIFPSAHQTESRLIFGKVKTVDVVADPEFKVGVGARYRSLGEHNRRKHDQCAKKQEQSGHLFKSGRSTLSASSKAPSILPIKTTFSYRFFHFIISRFLCQ